MPYFDMAPGTPTSVTPPTVTPMEQPGLFGGLGQWFSKVNNGLGQLVSPEAMYAGSGMTPEQMQAAQQQARTAMAAGLLSTIGSGKGWGGLAQGLGAGMMGAAASTKDATETAYRNTVQKKQIEREDRLLKAQEAELKRLEKEQRQKDQERYANIASRLATGLEGASDKAAYLQLVQGMPDVKETLAAYDIDPAALQSPELAPQAQAQLTAAGQLGTAPKVTDDLTEWQAARLQGYPGTFEEWQLRMRQAGATTVNLGAQGLSTPPTGYYRPKPSTPGLTIEPGGPVEEAAKKETEATRVAAGYFDRMSRAETLLDPSYTPTTQDYVAASTVLGASPLLSSVANLAISEEGQKYWQGAADWVRAKLRKESGAVIGDEEMQSELRTYFPVPNDSPALLKQKAEARAVATAGMQKQAGFSSVNPADFEARANAIWKELGGTPDKRAAALSRAKKEFGLAK